MPFETAIDQWRDGVARLDAASPDQQPALERATSAVEAALRRRLGGAFDVAELVELYDTEGTSWCMDVAIAATPEDPYAWDARIVADAAFGRYVRGATDFAGGRRLD